MKEPTTPAEWEALLSAEGMPAEIDDLPSSWTVYDPVPDGMVVGDPLKRRPRRPARDVEGLPLSVLLQLLGRPEIRSAVGLLVWGLVEFRWPGAPITMKAGAAMTAAWAAGWVEKLLRRARPG
jgi:hypothetical protein